MNEVDVPMPKFGSVFPGDQSYLSDCTKTEAMATRASGSHLEVILPTGAGRISPTGPDSFAPGRMTQFSAALKPYTLPIDKRGSADTASASTRRSSASRAHLTVKGEDARGLSDASEKKRKRRPNIDYSTMPVEEQLAFKKARARTYSALARERQRMKEEEECREFERLQVFKAMVEAAPVAMFLLSYEAGGRILYANAEAETILHPVSTQGVRSPIIGRHLSEWLDLTNNGVVLEAMGKSVLSKVAHTVQCSIWLPDGGAPSRLSKEKKHEDGRQPIKVGIKMVPCAWGVIVTLRSQDDQR